jgi:uncharacterized protein (DUF2252 family)
VRTSAAPRIGQEPSAWRGTHTHSVHKSTVDTGVRAGRVARRRLPHGALGDWHPAPDRPDPISQLEAQVVQLVPELVAIRFGRMLESPSAFFRGAAAIMASDLAATDSSDLEVQLCGDANIGNFAARTRADEAPEFDIVDFDETLAGPWEWDLKRLASSLEIDARESGIATRLRSGLVRSAIHRYQAAMIDFARRGYMSVWRARLGVAEVARAWAARPAVGRLTRAVGGRPRFVARPPNIERLEDCDDEESALFSREIETYLDAYRASLSPVERQILSRFTFSDGARVVGGIAGVGLRTNAVALFGGDPNEPLILQFKEARRSVLEPYSGRSTYSNSGRRIIEGRRLIQASDHLLLGWLRGTGVYGSHLDLYVRQVRDDGIAPESRDREARALSLHGRAAAWTLAHAHARTGDRAAIATYVGTGTRFADAILEFAAAYADQNESDHQALVEAVTRGRIIARTGV